MNIAIIGCGGIADIHIQALGRIGMKPCLIYSRTNRETASRYEVPVTNQLEDVLRLNCVSVHICTPPDTHRDLIRALIDRPDSPVRAIFCEKPLAESSEDAEEIRALLENACSAGRPIRFAVGFNTRFYPAVRTMRSLIREGAAGEIRLVHASYFQEFHALPDAFGWRYQSRTRALSEIGSHLFDLVRYITGEEVVPETARLLRADPIRDIDPRGVMFARGTLDESESAGTRTVESDDAALIHARLSRSGALVDLALSEITHGRKNCESIEIVGASKTFRWNSEDPMRLTISAKNRPSSVETYAFDSGFHDTFALQFREFYSEKEQADPALASIEDGVADSRLRDRVYRIDPGTRPDRIAAHYKMELIPEERVFVHVVARSRETDENGRARYNSMFGMHSNRHGSFSRFHRLDTDETWHYYEGDAFRIVLLVEGQPERVIEMGPNFECGQLRSFVVPKETWFASYLPTDRPDAYALFGCTLAPAFEQRGFEAGYADRLIADFPQSSEIIRLLAADGAK